MAAGFARPAARGAQTGACLRVLTLSGSPRLTGIAAADGHLYVAALDYSIRVFDGAVRLKPSSIPLPHSPLASLLRLYSIAKVATVRFEVFIFYSIEQVRFL